MTALSQFGHKSQKLSGSHQTEPVPFPVTRDDPLMHPTHDLNAALTTVEERVQVPRHLPEIVQQRGRHRVKGRKEQALVTVELGNRDEAPLCPVQLLIIGLLEIGHTLEASIVAIG